MKTLTKKQREKLVQELCLAKQKIATITSLLLDELLQTTKERTPQAKKFIKALKVSRQKHARLAKQLTTDLFGFQPPTFGKKP